MVLASGRVDTSGGAGARPQPCPASGLQSFQSEPRARPLHVRGAQSRCVPRCKRRRVSGDWRGRPQAGPDQPADGGALRPGPWTLATNRAGTLQPDARRTRKDRGRAHAIARRARTGEQKPWLTWERQRLSKSTARRFWKDCRTASWAGGAALVGGMSQVSTLDRDQATIHASLPKTALWRSRRFDPAPGWSPRIRFTLPIASS